MATDDASQSKLTLYALINSVFTLLSRFSGLIRDAILARALALSATSDAFFIGFLIPNLFRRLFGEGALTSSFLPHHAELLAKDEQLAKRFSGMVSSLLAVLLIGMMLIGEGILWLAQTYLPLDAHHILAVRYTMAMLPYLPMVCTVAFFAALLQQRNRFAAPAAAPLLLNVGMITAGGIALFLNKEAQTTGFLVALGVLAAGIAQLAWLGFLVRQDILIGKWTNECRDALKRMLKMMVPMVLSLGIFQINTLADSLIAFFLAQPEGSEQTLNLFNLQLAFPCKEGAVAALNWAQRLYQFPVGVFGIAVATATFPALSKAAQAFKQDERIAHDSDYTRTLRQGIRLSFFIGMPATIGVLLVSLPLTRTIYEGAKFDLADSQRVAFILTGYAASIWAYSLNHVITRAYHSRKDAKTPLRHSMYGLGLNICLNICLIWPLGAAGLAWSTAASSLFTCLINLRGLSKHHLNQHWLNRSDLKQLAIILCASLLMGISLWPLRLVVDPATFTKTWQSLAYLLGMIAAGGTLYLLMAKIFKLEELLSFKRILKR